MFNLNIFKSILDIDKTFIFLTIIVILLPLVISGYLITKNIQNTMEKEKIDKLFGVAKTLDQLFDSDYETILKENNMETASRQDKIKFLSEKLTGLSDSIGTGFPNTGIGYYSKNLDAIITYSPSDKMGHTVGMSITNYHGGREAMKEGRWLSYKGAELVWGDGIAVFYPMIRNGEVIGYIWGVELVDEIEKQLFQTKASIFIAMVIGLGIAITGLSLLVRSNIRFIKILKSGIDKLKIDLNFRLPKLSGISGEISNDINKMADELAFQKNMETKMLKTEQMMVLGFVTLSIAHEIKNPLMAIRGFTQLIQEVNREPNILKYLTIIEKETKRMDKLINNLLDHSKDKKYLMKEQTVNILLEDCINLMSSNFRQAKIHLEVNIDEIEEYVYCESDKFKQVILNLLLNAMAAVEENSKTTNGKNKIICVSALKVDGYIKIDIQDNGTGIEEDMFKNIFSPFYSTKINGTGLGLFVVKGIIDSMGWSISVNSQIGIYTNFTIYIPLDLNVNNTEVPHEI